jgi:hypothetical protein
VPAARSPVMTRHRLAQFADVCRHSRFTSNDTKDTGQDAYEGCLCVHRIHRGLLALLQRYAGLKTAFTIVGGVLVVLVV